MMGFDPKGSWRQVSLDFVVVVVEQLLVVDSYLCVCVCILSKHMKEMCAVCELGVG